MNVILFDETGLTVRTTPVIQIREVYNIHKGTLRMPDTACVWFPKRMAFIMEALVTRGRDEFITRDYLASILWGDPDRWSDSWAATVTTYMAHIRKAMLRAGLRTLIRNRRTWGYHLEPMPLVEP